ncbi:MAG: hypothetical protein E6J34_18265, partial [Chloroflexi bacterium]
GQPTPPLIYRATAWSPDNKLLAVGGQNNETLHVFLTIWELASGAQIFSTSYVPAAEIGNGAQGFMAVIWSPDGKRLAMMSETTGVKVWDVSRKKLLQSYVGSGEGFNGAGLAWSPDGKYIAVGEQRVVRIWDTTTGQTRFSYRGHQGNIYWLSWSPRGNYIASASYDSVRVWRAVLD